MNTGPSVVLRFNELDKAALVELANRLEMSQTKTIRVLVRETLNVLKERETQLSATTETARQAKSGTTRRA